MTESPAKREGESSTRAHRSWRRGGLLVLAIAICLLMAGVWLYRAWTRPTAPAAGAGVQIVRVARGLSLTAVSDTLSRRGLLERPWLFRAVARLTGRDRHLQAGRYALPAGLAPRDLLARLVEGRSLPVTVTIPEGVTVDEAAELAATALGFAPAAFLAAADSSTRAGIATSGLMGTTARLAAHDSLLRDTGSTSPRPLHWAEGYLAPDTYFFAEGTGPQAAAAAMVALGLARVDSAVRTGAALLAELNLVPHDLVTLASLVEAEVRRGNERSLVAAVYTNRLREGWRLEADPCVAYLLGKQGQRLYYRDLQVVSPYNTYRRIGLPPGPISNPGLAALGAAAQPDTACRAMFFVADGEGGHVFSRTSTEHARAVELYRQRRRSPSR